MSRVNTYDVMFNSNLTTYLVSFSANDGFFPTLDPSKISAIELVHILHLAFLSHNHVSCTYPSSS